MLSLLGIVMVVALVLAVPVAGGIIGLCMLVAWITNPDRSGGGRAQGVMRGMRQGRRGGAAPPAMPYPPGGPVRQPQGGPAPYPGGPPGQQPPGAPMPYPPAGPMAQPPAGAPPRPPGSRHRAGSGAPAPSHRANR